ncbi:unnamed protein product [Symbiodinium natans]|uniref:CCHC-type domain-containing protein n=1 Tax=Symbiodinium natans TaxID=878477 RepID=A0A812TBG8_9DINO|nr:unnamed protein product [Symbiodinium natans]
MSSQEQQQAQVTAAQVMQELVNLRNELTRQREENDRLRAEQSTALERVRQESAAQVAEVRAQAHTAVQQATAQMGTMPQLVSDMVKSNKELVEAMAKKGGPNEKLCLVDTKGLGKPTTFSGESEQFLPWRHRMSSYVCSIHHDLQEVLEWLEEREKPFSSEELDTAFGEKALEADRVPRLQEKSRELANALQMVTSKEPFTIVCNCQNNGFEAWRRLTRRYDPATASRKRTMLRAIISPQKQKLENLPQAIEEWADAVRTYEKRKDSAGRRTTLADEIKMAALEAMLPQELESHIQLNQSRFSTYDDVLDEVTRFIEYKTGKSLKVISAAAASAASKDDPMDLSYVERGKGKGASKVVCHNCGRSGHYARDCWSNGGKGSQQQRGSPKGNIEEGGENTGEGNQDENWQEGEEDEGWEDGDWGETWEDGWEEAETNNLYVGALERESPKREKEKKEKESKPDPGSRGSSREEGSGPTVLGAMAPKNPKRKVPPKEEKDEDEKELEALEEQMDRARGQFQDLKEKVELARRRRQERLLQEAEELAEARRRSRGEVPGQSSFGAFSSSSRGPPERVREPKAGKKEEKKEVRSKALDTAPWKRVSRYREPPVPEPRSPASWAGMRFRERVAHQDAIRDKKPRGTVGESLLKKQGEACSTCVSRRLKFRSKASLLLKKRMKEYKAAAAKAAGSHYARKVFEREKLVRADRPSKAELRSAKVAEKVKQREEEAAGEEEEEDKFSLEPESSEDESDFEDDPPSEGPEEPKKEEKKKPPKQEEGTEGATAITASTSSSMQRMLASGLMETNRANLAVLDQRIATKKEKLEGRGSDPELEAEIASLEDERKRLKEERERLRAQQAGVKKKEPEHRRDQSVHDVRYKRQVEKGDSHWKAWRAEKGRSRPTRSGTPDTTRKMKKGDFRDNQKEEVDGIDTEVIHSDGTEAKPERRKDYHPLTKAERTSHRVDADDEEELYRKELEKQERPKATGRYSADPSIAAEQKKKRNQKRNQRRNKLKRKLGSTWDPEHKGKKKVKKSEDDDEETVHCEDHDDRRDPRGEDPEDPGEGGVRQSVHSFETVDAASLGASPGVASVEVNFDTGAAVTVLPEKYVTQPKDNGVRYKTASGEALKDQGKAEVTGTLSGGRGATITGRGAGVHRILLSGAQACKTHFAFLHGTGGLLVPKGTAFAKEADEALRQLAWKHKGVGAKMQVKNRIYVFPLQDEKKGVKGGSKGQAEMVEEAAKRKAAGKATLKEKGGTEDDRFAEEPEAPGEEQQRAIVPKSPDQPTADQIAQHEASGHAVHRSWCVHCQRARKMVNPHYRIRRAELETSLPTLHMDYFFLGKEKQEDDVMPRLVVRCDKTQRTWATSLPEKGTHAYNVTWLASVIREAGWKRMCLFSDNEHALRALKLKASEEVQNVVFDLRESPTSTEHENAPSNGIAEAAVREVKRMVRAILSELETKLKIEVGVDHPILAWIARHAAFLMTRFRIGEDGKSAYERTLGRPWRRPTIVFGEQVMFKPVGSRHKRGSLDARVCMGRYVGTASRNADLLIMTSEGISRGHSLHRRPEDEKWPVEGFEVLRGLPWRMSGPQERASPNRVGMPALEGEQPAPQHRDFKARNLCVMKSDIELYGYTPQCPGCDAQLMGLPQRARNDECRMRVQRRLQETDEGKERVKRAQERVEKDYGKRVKRDQPALEGRPAPDAMDVAAEEAAGAPLSRPMEVEDRAEPKQRKRAVEDLYREEPSTRATDGPDVEVIGVHVQGGASGSAGPGLDHSHQQARADAEMYDTATANPPPANEEVRMNLITRMFEQKGLKCSPTEAKAINSMVLQLGGNGNSAVPWSMVNEGIILPMDQEPPMFAQAEHLRFFEKLEQVKPKLLVGKLPTGPFQSVQRAFDMTNKIGVETRRGNLRKARSQLGLCFEAFEAQKEAGNYFLYECPRGTKSWEHELAQRMGSYLVEGPMCKWKVDESGKMIAGQSGKKRTRWITNSATVATALEKLCKGNAKVWNRTLSFKEGIVTAKAEYPPKLERALLAGVRAQLVLDGEMKEVGHVGGPDPHEEPPLEEYLHDTLPKAGQLHVSEPVIDANTGAQLDARKVAEARASELAWVKKQGVYEKVEESVCWDETGRPPITLKWVDRNKGDDVRENYRSRLVVREVKSQGQAALIPDYALFSSMPPLEGLKILCSLLTTLKRSKGGKKLTLKLTDISRAHFYGKAERRVFVTLPEGDEAPGFCGLLKRTMYGTRDASAVWQRSYTSLLRKHGFVVGKAYPCTFYHAEADVRLLVHGDDFLVLADEDGHRFVDKVLSEEYEFKCDGHIGPECEKDSMTVLNRVVSYDSQTGTVTYEADPRHAEALVRDLGLESAKAAKTPAEKKKGSDLKAMLEAQPLNAELQKAYRSHTMRAAFLAQDRPDIAEATKSLARHMKEPTEWAWADLKRLVRYLRGNPRLIYEYHPQRFSKEIVMYCDSDHAGCLITRRSTTGLVTMLGSHCVKHSSNVQSTISLSSGESEFYAIVRAGSIGLSLQAMLEDWGLKVSLRIRSDSSAARGTTQRQGLGQARHVQTRYLWVQEKVATRALELERVGTEKNYSDICTKPMPEVAMLKHLKNMGLRFHVGRAGAAKRLV